MSDFYGWILVLVPRKLESVKEGTTLICLDHPLNLIVKAKL